MKNIAANYDKTPGLRKKRPSLVHAIQLVPQFPIPKDYSLLAPV
jgi:hypothetical protein